MKSFHKKMRDELQSRSVEWQAFEVGAKEGIRKGVEKFFAAADIDGDGAVDRDEFTQHMRENREAQKILDHLGLSFSGIIKSEMVGFSCLRRFLPSLALFLPLSCSLPSPLLIKLSSFPSLDLFLPLSCSLLSPLLLSVSSFPC